jgi:hypothetical protein
MATISCGCKRMRDCTIIVFYKVFLPLSWYNTRHGKDLKSATG